MTGHLPKRLAKACRWLPLAALGWLPQHAQAQTLNYLAANAVNTAGTYTDLGTTGTAIATANNDDANSAAQNIGFTFSYGGQSFTQFVLNTNGIIRLGAAAPSVANLFANYEAGQNVGVDPITSTNAADVNLLAPFNFDLENGTATGGAEYRVATTGTAPNRVCTIQWKNVRDKTDVNAAQYASFNFQLKLYETTNNIEFVYGSAVAATTGTDIARFPTVGIKGAGSANGQTVLGSKTASTAAWSTTVFITGVYGTSTHNYRRTVPPDAGRTYRFVPTVLAANDVAVNAVFSLGQVAQGVTDPHVVRAQVTNNSAGTLTNVPVTLSVTGANTFTNVQTVASLASGASTTVTFTGYPLTNLGNNTLTVTVPADDLNTNNSKTYAQTVTTDRLSYTEPNGTFNTTGVGVGAAGGALAVRYTISTATIVSSIRATFQGAGTANTTYQVQLFNAAGTGGTPGTALFTSPVQARPGATGTVTIPVPNIGVTAGDVFVVVREIDNNVGLAYQVEDPLRPSTFYFQTSATGAWTLVNTTTLRTRLALDLGLGAVTCPSVSNLATSNVTATGATVTFTPATGATNYTVTYAAGTGAPVTVTPTPTGSPVTLTGLTPGTTYTVNVTTNCPGSQTSITSTTTFTTPFVAPANDLCSGAIALTCGSTITGTTVGATSTGEPTTSCSSLTPSTSPGVFYSYAGNGQSVTISSCSGPTATTGDTKIFVYTGTCGAFTCVTSSDDVTSSVCSGNTLSSSVTFPTVAGTTYYVMVQFYNATGSAAVTGPFGLTTTCTGTPTATRNEIGAGVLDVFPNPASGNFTLRLPAISGQRTAQVTLLNSLGQQVQTRTLDLQAAGTQSQFDVSNLAKGLYTLRVQAGSHTAVKQVVVE